jgi:hypothetical protein
LAAVAVAAVVTPAEAASRAHHKRAQPSNGWQNPSHLIGGKAIFDPAASTFGGYPSWARIAFEQGQNGQ